MKKTLIAVSAAACLLLGSSVLADTKIGVVNTNELFLKASSIVAKRNELNKKFEDQGKKINDAQKDFQTSIEAFSKNSPTMKEDAKKAEQQKIVDKQKELQKMQTKFQNDAAAAQDDLIKDFTKKMRAAVDKIAADKKLDLIVDKAGVAFNKKELEVTDDVLKQLNK